MKKKGSYDIDSLLGTETNVPATASPQRDVTEGNDEEKEDAGKSIEIKVMQLKVDNVFKRWCYFNISTDLFNACF